MPKIIIYLLLILPFGELFAQEKYWIFIEADKEPVSTSQYLSAQTYQNRLKQGLPVFQQSDLPINQSVLDSLTNLEVNVICQSKWLNAVSAELDSEQVELLKGKSYIKSLELLNPNLKIMSAAIVPHQPDKFSLALEQINAKAFLDQKWTGKGVKIGIIDGGFLGAPEEPSLESLFERNLIGEKFDFVEPENPDMFNLHHSSIDWHGTSVWTMIGGYDKYEKVTYGVAKDASYYLARTDHGQKEFRGEEDYWIQAVEWLDSLGVRLVNTSLGYSLDFDNPEENYSPEDMDGKTTMITRAAQIAADQKGMLIVVSAGNDGDNNNWRIVSAPADAEAVLSVGATNFTIWDKVNYSALGPEFLPYLKPDLSIYSSLGTSFSAPVVTGIAAGIMQENPQLSSLEIIEVLKKNVIPCTL